MTDEQLIVVLRFDEGQQFSDGLRGELAARNRRLPDFKRVSGYVIWDEDFPRTASLKVKRNILAERIRNRLDRQSGLVQL
jgi:acyl-coenzyme A synthetase/AMP-(fatty) acid ligase